MQQQHNTEHQFCNEEEIINKQNIKCFNKKRIINNNHLNKSHSDDYIERMADAILYKKQYNNNDKYLDNQQLYNKDMMINIRNDDDDDDDDLERQNHNIKQSHHNNHKRKLNDNKQFNPMTNRNDNTNDDGDGDMDDMVMISEKNNNKNHRQSYKNNNFNKNNNNNKGNV